MSDLTLLTAANDDQIDKIAARVFEKTDLDSKSGCLLWNGATNGKYPIMKIFQKVYYVHRVMYCFANPGWDWDKYPIIMHRCDNPRCVSPAHLMAGTQKDNCNDMLVKGRGSGFGVIDHANRILGHIIKKEG